MDATMDKQKIASCHTKRLAKPIMLMGILTHSSILQNIVDETNIIAQLKDEGFDELMGDGNTYSGL